MNTKEVRIVSESIKGEWRARERTIAKDICSNCSGLTENLRYGKANRSISFIALNLLKKLVAGVVLKMPFYFLA